MSLSSFIIKTSPHLSNRLFSDLSGEHEIYTDQCPEDRTDQCSLDPTLALYYSQAECRLT